MVKFHGGRLVLSYFLSFDMKFLAVLLRNRQTRERWE